jgi:hypothetical protein
VLISPIAVALRGSTSLRFTTLVVAAGLLALVAVAVPATSRGATVFTHSAESGQLRDGLLTLRGVGGRVPWAQHGGRSGSVSVVRLHRRLFVPQTPPIGTLHIAGRRPQTLRLRRPRYNAVRKTVRYRVQRLSRRTDRRAEASQALGEFGAAGLSIIPHPSLLTDDDGNYCAAGVLNLTIHELQATSTSKWDTDDWDPGVPSTLERLGGTVSWASQGGFLRGCSNTVVWTAGTDPPITFTVTTTHPFPGKSTETCKSSDRSYLCERTLGIDEANWIIRPNL